MKPSDMCVIMGDFNLPNISWLDVDDSPFLCPSRHSEFVDSMLDISLHQINNVLNANAKLLDLIFVDPLSDVSLSRSVSFSLPEDVHHPPLEITLRSCVCQPSLPKCDAKRPFFNFRAANFQALLLALSDVDWLSISDLSDVDIAVEMFYNTLYNLFRVYVPVTVPSRTRSRFPWFNRELCLLKNRRNRLYKKYRNSGTANDFLEYSRANYFYNSCNQKHYRSFIHKQKSKISTDPRQFYKLVNMKRRSRVLPSGMKLDDGETAYGSDVCALFARFFASNYSSAPKTDTAYPYNVDEGSLVSIAPITDDDVWNHLQLVKPSYSSGPDSIPNVVLKCCADYIAAPLASIFNLSLRSGRFPSKWKTSYIFPIHKKGPKNVVSNYRGIAKASAIPLLFEKIVIEQLTHCLHTSFSPCQHGFIRGRSTCTNLLELTTTINAGFASNLQTDVIFTDFSKAFDSVNHELLLTKLNKIGFSRRLVSWFSSYLSGRTQYVFLDGILSTPINVLSGVPQGSHLGPLLFNIFINDLPGVVKFSRVLLYADDAKLFKILDSPDAPRKLQLDLNSVIEWCNVNQLRLNAKKCYTMCFSRRAIVRHIYSLGTTKLPNVDTFRDLGISLDSKLTFNSHILLAVSRFCEKVGKGISRSLCS